eukprot:m.124389 g.124389  ORF g.124389 m.124389 type:complete len:202 (+) comp37847_c0_seq20:1071-1676(+)
MESARRQTYATSLASAEQSQDRTKEKEVLKHAFKREPQVEHNARILPLLAKFSDVWTAAEFSSYNPPQYVLEILDCNKLMYEYNKAYPPKGKPHPYSYLHRQMVKRYTELSKNPPKFHIELEQHGNGFVVRKNKEPSSGEKRKGVDAPTSDVKFMAVSEVDLSSNHGKLYERARSGGSITRCGGEDQTRSNQHLQYRNHCW